MKKLSDPGKFLGLDGKLNTALLKLCKGDLGSKVFQHEEEINQKDGFYRGRMLLKHILKWNTGLDAEASLHDFEDLQAVQLHQQSLRKFQDTWDYIWKGLSERPSESTKRSLYYNQVKKFQPLSQCWERYELRSHRRPKKTYHWLHTQVRRYLATQKRKQDIAARRKGLAAQIDLGPLNATTQNPFTPYRKKAKSQSKS